VGHVSDGLLRTLLTKVHQIYSFPEWIRVLSENWT
jgi:hypothetical protein